MTYDPSMPEAQAIGLCWLARQPGLPDADALRRAVVQLHPEPCGWCEYEPSDLMAMLKGFNPTAFAERDWWSMPGKARLAAIHVAAGVIERIRES